MVALGKVAVILVTLGSVSLHLTEFELPGVYDCTEFSDFHMRLELRPDGTAERRVLREDGRDGDLYAGTWERVGDEVRVTWTEERDRDVPPKLRLAYCFDIEERNLVLSAYLVGTSRSELAPRAYVRTDLPLSEAG